MDLPFPGVRGRIVSEPTEVTPEDGAFGTPRVFFCIDTSVGLTVSPVTGALATPKTLKE